MKKYLRTIGFMFALVFLLLPVIALANTSEDDLHVNVINKEEAIPVIREQLLEENVPKEDVEVLIEKFKNGEAWDSFKEEYKNIKPQIVKENYSKTIYPDGSFVIDEIKEIPRSKSALFNSFN